MGAGDVAQQGLILSGGAVCQNNFGFDAALTALERVPAERGQLVCLLGGDPAVADAAAPLLRPMCKEQIYCGTAGDTLRMKLAINLYLCSSLIALAEATNFARKANLPRTSSSKPWRSAPSAAISCPSSCPR